MYRDLPRSSFAIGSLRPRAVASVTQKRRLPSAKLARNSNTVRFFVCGILEGITKLRRGRKKTTIR